MFPSVSRSSEKRLNKLTQQTYRPRFRDFDEGSMGLERFEHRHAKSETVWISLLPCSLSLWLQVYFSPFFSTHPTIARHIVQALKSCGSSPSSNHDFALSSNTGNPWRMKELDKASWIACNMSWGSVRSRVKRILSLLTQREAQRDGESEHLKHFLLFAGGYVGKPNWGYWCSWKSLDKWNPIPWAGAITGGFSLIEGNPYYASCIWGFLQMRRSH